MHRAKQLRCFKKIFCLVLINFMLSTLIIGTSYAQEPTYVAGSSKILYPITDDWVAYGVYGTDLGISTMHGGLPFFLFGDTWFGEGHPNDLGPVMAHTMNYDPEASKIVLFPKLEPPGIASIIRISGLTTQNPFEVPVGCISYNSKLYMAFTSYTVPNTTIATFMCSTEDNGLSWTMHYELSDGDYSGTIKGPNAVPPSNPPPKFIHVAMELVPANTFTSAQMPYANKDAVLMFGSGYYRESDVYLAVMPADGLKTRSNIRYYNGTSSWATRERDAIPIIYDGDVGELSVTWHEQMGRYILLYGGDWGYWSNNGCGWTWIAEDPAVKMRTSALPWAGWSKAQVLYKTSEAIRDGFVTPNSGGLYAPYIVDAYSRTNGNIHTIYYTLSTWDPYHVVLAKSNIRYP